MKKTSVFLMSAGWGFIFGGIMKQCKVDGCERKSRSRGYCAKHYGHFLRHGKILSRTRFSPNKIIMKENSAEIILYDKNCNEKERTIIDSEDTYKIKPYKWHYNYTGYVETHIKGRLVGIQHIVTGIKRSKDHLIDHKDRNPLNNCKSNLRLCTYSENNMNRVKQKNNRSGFTGVSWYKRIKKWRARIMVGRKEISLGYFLNKGDACKAYNKAAIKHHGEFAALNEVS